MYRGIFSTSQTRSSRPAQISQRMDFIRKKRLALAVAIITQLRIAAIEYDFAVNRYTRLKDLALDSEEIIVNAEKAAKAGKGKKSIVIMKKLDALRDYASTMDAYNQVMIARAKIQNSIGADPIADGSLSINIPVREDTDSPENSNTIYITDNTLPVITTEDTPPLATSNSRYHLGFKETYALKEEPIVLEQYSSSPKKYFEPDLPDHSLTIYSYTGKISVQIRSRHVPVSLNHF